MVAFAQPRREPCGSPGVKLFVVWWLAGWLALVPARASLRSVRQAEALLGPHVWSRVLQIENTTARSIYPRTVYALVFEFNGLLWFYCDTDGTQSFSLHTNRLAEEQADFAPLLRAIDPGFVHFRVLPRELNAPPKRRRPPNACFIESVVALRESLANDATITDAALLAYYVAERGRSRGHTVLLLERGAGNTYVVDAQLGRRRVTKPPGPLDDALAWARAVEGSDGARVAAAKWVPAGTRIAPEFAELGQRRLERELKMERTRIAAGARCRGLSQD